MQKASLGVSKAKSGVASGDLVVADLIRLFARYLVEKYTDAARERAEVRGGLPIRQLHKVEDYVSARLAEEISVDALAGLVELSPFHFSRVFRQTTCPQLAARNLAAVPSMSLVFSRSLPSPLAAYKQFARAKVTAALLLQNGCFPFVAVR